LATLVLNERTADITATDYHPEAETFLLENIKLNKGNPIPFFCTAWGEPNAGMGDFDLIIGSDLLYEQGHAELLAGFIDQHAKAQCEVVLVDPGRGMLGRFTRIMASFGYVSSKHQPSNSFDANLSFKGSILHYVR
jgi:predicted nicotinamide N-methyase